LPNGSVIGCARAMAQPLAFSPDIISALTVVAAIAGSS
jgi:hypothetical protein